ncbi:hypothetical protein H6P81_016571 [Aristolochia fimbriata]|uniref:Uncharacterized protein n=1 Tax=Aristolochia fimbriata TaxID=158543 RepID=A0AAV7EBR8_ARIFI|nr:hypothetical protein H6P81_016571 [Aristolochia fimbriata]
MSNRPVSVLSLCLSLDKAPHKKEISGSILSDPPDCTATFQSPDGPRTPQPPPRSPSPLKSPDQARPEGTKAAGGRGGGGGRCRPTQKHLPRRKARDGDVPSRAETRVFYGVLIDCGRESLDSPCPCGGRGMAAGTTSLSGEGTCVGRWISTVGPGPEEIAAVQ